MGLLEEIQAKQERLEAKQAQQEKELTILRRLVIENGERISTAEIQRMTGITDTRTLKKRFNWLQKGTGPITWSKSEVLQWLTENELKAA